jgi:glycine cleavage system protein P-like pyridoxal-binding family
MADEMRRRTDRWFGFLTRLWDWIDDRDIDKHTVSVAVFYGTVKITAWSMVYAETSSRPGLEVAAILAAVGAPYMALQAAALSFYFRARV